MDIIGNCLVPHQPCQQLQVGGKIVGVPRSPWIHRERHAKWTLRGADARESGDAIRPSFHPP